MKHKRTLRLVVAFLAVVLCIPAFSVTAFAYGSDAEATGGPVRRRPLSRRTIRMWRH